MKIVVQPCNIVDCTAGWDYVIFCIFAGILIFDVRNSSGTLLHNMSKFLNNLAEKVGAVVLSDTPSNCVFGRNTGASCHEFYDSGPKHQ